MKKSFTTIALGLKALEFAALKRFSRTLSFIFFVWLALMSSSCEEKDVSPDKDPDIEDTDPDTSIDTDTIHAEFDSSIGLIIDTRPIFKKGYKPVEAKIDISGEYANYSQTLPIDKFTSLAILRINIDELTEDQIEQLALGVHLTIQILDIEQKILAEISDENTPINDTNIPNVIETKLPKVFEPVILNPSIPYLVKLSDYGDQSMWHIYEMSLHTSFYNEDDFTSFYFEPVAEGNDSTYYIRDSQSNLYLHMEEGFGYFNMQALVPILDVSEESSLQDEPSFKFVLKRDEDGISIRPLNGVPLRVSNRFLSGQRAFISDEFNEFNVARLRIAPANIQWTVEDLGTEFNAPILPPVNIDFAYNSRLENCSDAKVTESVGKQDTRISSYTFSSEESFQLSESFLSTESETTNLSSNLNIAGVDVGGYSYEMSTSLSYGSDSTSTSTKGFSETGQHEVQVSRIRTIELAPYSGVEVYDIVMSLKQVRIAFAQKIRVKGQYENGTKLSGQEIASQLMSRPFDGVITEVGSNYIIFTIKGDIRVDEAIEATTRVRELDLKDICL